MGDAEPEAISKNALKKQQKAEEAAKKKAAKELDKAAKASTVAPTTKSGNVVMQIKIYIRAMLFKYLWIFPGPIADDAAEDLDPTQYYENRLKTISNLEVSM